MPYIPSNLHFAVFPLFPTDAKLHRDGGRSRQEQVGNGGWVRSAGTTERKEMAALKESKRARPSKSTQKNGGLF